MGLNKVTSKEGTLKERAYVDIEDNKDNKPTT